MSISQTIFTKLSGEVFTSKFSHPFLADSVDPRNEGLVPMPLQSPYEITDNSFNKTTSSRDPSPKSKPYQAIVEDYNSDSDSTLTEPTFTEPEPQNPSMPDSSWSSCKTPFLAHSLICQSTQTFNPCILFQRPPAVQSPLLQKRTNPRRRPPAEGRAGGQPSAAEQRQASLQGREVKCGWIELCGCEVGSTVYRELGAH